MFCFFEFELFNLLQTSQQIENLSSTHRNRLKSIAPTSASLRDLLKFQQVP